MFGNSSQEIFTAVGFLQAQKNTSSCPQTELAFVLKARVAPMKVMTVLKLELQAALLATRSYLLSLYSACWQSLYVNRRHYWLAVA